MNRFVRLSTRAPRGTPSVARVAPDVTEPGPSDTSTAVYLQPVVKASDFKMGFSPLKELRDSVQISCSLGHRSVRGLRGLLEFVCCQLVIYECHHATPPFNQSVSSTIPLARIRAIRRQCVPFHHLQRCWVMLPTRTAGLPQIVTNFHRFQSHF